MSILQRILKQCAAWRVWLLRVRHGLRYLNRGRAEPFFIARTADNRQFPNTESEYLS